MPSISPVPSCFDNVHCSDSNQNSPNWRSMSRMFAYNAPTRESIDHPEIPRRRFGESPPTETSQDRRATHSTSIGRTEEKALSERLTNVSMGVGESDEHSSRTLLPHHMYLEERFDSGFCPSSESCSSSTTDSPWTPPGFKQDVEGDNPLMLAVLKRAGDVVSAILESTTDARLLDRQNEYFQTALHLAALTSQPEFVRMLLITGANPLRADCDGNTPLAISAGQGCVESMRALTTPIQHSEIEHITSHVVPHTMLPQNCNVHNYEGYSPLHIATISGKANSIRFLLSLPTVDVNFREGKAGYTALHLAVDRESDGIVEVLLEGGANVNARSYDGLSPIELAFCRGNETILRRLQAVADTRSVSGVSSASTVSSAPLSPLVIPQLPFLPSIPSPSCEERCESVWEPLPAYSRSESSGSGHTESSDMDEEMQCLNDPKR